MDISTILGIIIGIFLIINGIGFDKIGNFVDVDSVIIVLGGTVCAVIASFPLTTLKDIPKHFKIIMQGKKKKYDPTQCIETLVELAQIARKNGLLALEERANELTDPFFKSSVMLIVDVTDEEKIRNTLENELNYLDERHESGVSIYEKASSFAPAFGMIGTLVGLINMLKGMSLDGGGQSSLGEDMSVALVTTFYGCVLANLIFSPIAKKLRIRNEEEYLFKQIIIEGVLSIQAGDNPKYLKEKLCTYLSQKEREKAMGAEGEGQEGKKGGKAKKEPKAKKAK